MQMKSETNIKLAENRLGRAILHLKCLARDRKWAWHLAGLRRELFGRGCDAPSQKGVGDATVAISSLTKPSRRHECGLVILAAFFAVTLSGLATDNSGYYSEPFRPQYHFTPEKNWMNDPNGLVYYKGEYHLFYQYNPFGDKWGHMSWGHAVSADMVHWKHLPLALPEADNVMIFSGSAVVDWHNTSGFGQDGQPPMVAIYTGYNTTNNLQYQCIAYSNDKGRTWTKYSGNPVINLNSKDFRDPKVQWYEPTKSWLMTVSLSTLHKVRFYGSKNLKDWMLLSEFGPAGGTAGVWECPDLFELPVQGTAEKRWVLAVNMNPGSIAGGSGGQYFVGQFDGTRFTADPGSLLPPTPAFAPEGQVIADFEGKDYGNWKTTGDAFGPGPSQGRLADQNPVDGYEGHGLVNSYYHGDASTGTLTSPAFEITHPYLNFLIGGGSQKETCMDLLVGGKVVRTASGDDAERLAWKSWDVHEFQNQKAVLQIVDNATGGWGHINLDQITLADEAAHPASESALWFDYGPDYYAAVSWSDIPKSDGRRLWLGWMSNWEYGQQVPTSPWRSAMSIPREVGLRQTPEGIRLVQNPVRELQSLRDEHFKFIGGDVAAANDWIAQKHIQGDELEFEVEFDPQSTGVEGVKVFKSAKQATVIGVNRDKGTVFVDRTHSGNVDFSPQFSGVYSAPLDHRDGKVKLHIFVDACSLEVFVNDGEKVFTVLAYPSAASRGVEFFGPASSAKIGPVNVWKLKSVWR
jgi:sucrose-6-phosphate hydrolase SacC (GH32 family)